MRAHRHTQRSTPRPGPWAIVFMSLLLALVWAGETSARSGRRKVGKSRRAKARKAIEVTDAWATLCPGVRYLHRVTTEPVAYHIVEIDLRRPDLRIEVTPRKHRWRTTTQFGRVTGAVAAVNAGFWSVFDAKAEGLVIHKGKPWPDVADDEFYGFFGVGNSGRAVISSRTRVVTKTGWLREAVSGLQLILDRGKVAKEARCADGCRHRHPRTAVGVSRDGWRVFLAVVDGRQAHSRGVSLATLGRTLAGLGAWRAINLDGGGSSAMYQATRKRLVSRPADRKEREVLNHVGVYWRPSAARLRSWQAEQARKRAAVARARRKAMSALTGDATALSAGAPGVDPPLALLSGPPKPTTEGVPTGFRRWLQLHWREILSPRNLLLGGAPLLLLGLVLVWRRRRRRQRRRVRA